MWYKGGNFFCAINKKGQKFYIIGENVLSENMLANNSSDRQKTLRSLADDFNCKVEEILIMPQWTYHLDLQMAYLGQSQFIVHSFDQDNFDFGQNNLGDTKNTFDFLKIKFERDIVEKICKILAENDFDVKKVFGCLFYLTDLLSDEQLRNVSHCTSSYNKGFEVSLMNGFSLMTTDNKKYFISVYSDNEKFKSQFEDSLKSFGVNVKYIDVNEKSKDNCITAKNYMAQLHGGLRCQTSILNKSVMKPTFPAILIKQF